MYVGKAKFDDLNRFEKVEDFDGFQVYTAIVNSECVKRNLRIVYLVKHDKLQTTLFFSTEFRCSFHHSLSVLPNLFRDVKQFLGLNRCQAALHFNASMTALIKLEDRRQDTNS